MNGPRIASPGESTFSFVNAPPRAWPVPNVKELWAYRELLFFLAWRDVKVRYKQAFAGIAWAVIQPLVLMAIFSLFFGRFVNVPSEGIAYPLFAFSGLLPWIYFSGSVGASSQSVVADSNLITKVYFPRLLIPLSSIGAYLIDLGVGSILLLILMGFYGYFLTWTALLTPLFVLFAILASLSVGIWLSALNVAYRDVRYVVPFLVQVWLFMTPVVYPANLVPKQYQWLYALNPMVGVIEGFRWALLSVGDPPWTLMVSSGAAVFILLIGGLFYFRRVEHYFADLI